MCSSRAEGFLERSHAAAVGGRTVVAVAVDAALLHAFGAVALVHGILEATALDAARAAEAEGLVGLLESVGELDLQQVAPGAADVLEVLEVDGRDLVCREALVHVEVVLGALEAGAEGLLELRDSEADGEGARLVAALEVGIGWG